MWHRDQYRRNPYGGSIYPPSARYAKTSPASLANDSTATGNGTTKGQGRLRFAAIVYGALGLVAIFSNFELLPTGAAAFARQLHRMLTTNGVLCISNIYATPEQAVSMPEVPAMDDQYIPSYIKICYEWMRREALLPLPSPDCSQTPCACPLGYVYNVNRGCVHETLRISENSDICVDWRAPHYAMMEILASSILQTVIPELEYKHLCANQRKYTSDEAILGFDWTPFQTTFKQATLGVDTDLFPNAVEDLKSQCKLALKEYDPANEAVRARSRSLHHPFSFPKTSVLYQQPLTLQDVSQRTELDWIPEYPTPLSSNLAPISSVARAVRARLHNSALEWVDVTNAPDNEAIAGTVIIVDNGSFEMDPAIFNEYIASDKVTSISILSSPLCVTANLPTGKPCMTYKEDLRSYFASQYPDLDTSGAITSKVVASSSGEWSRAMNAQNLMCPPNTFSCLLPALGKIPQDVPSDSPLPATILFDVPESGAAAKFMEAVGRCGETPATSPETCAKVIQLATIEDAPVVEGTPDEPDPIPVPLTIGGDEPASSFVTETETVTPDGFIAANYTPPADGDVDPVVAAQESPQASYLGVEPNLPETVQNASIPEEELEQATSDPFAATQDTLGGGDGFASPLGAADDTSTTVDKSQEVVFTSQEIQQAVDTGTPLEGNAGPTPEELDGAPPSDASLLVADETVESQLETSFLDEVTYADLIDERMLSMERIKEEHFVAPELEIHCPEETPTGDVQVLQGGYTMVDDSASGTVTISDQNGVVNFQAPVTISSITPERGTFFDPYNHSISYEVDYITVYDSVLQDYVNVTGTIVSKAGSDLRVQDSVGSLYVDPTTLQGSLLLDGKAADVNSAENTHTLITGTVIGVGVDSLPELHHHPQGIVVMDKTGGLQVVAQDDTDRFLVDQDPAEQPMAPADPYQMPTTSSLTESIDRQLSPVFPDGITTDQCQLQVDDNPIYLDNHVQVPGQITFDLKQVWKEKKHISWVAVDYEYRRAYSCNDITRNPCSAENLNAYFEADAHNQFIHCGQGNIFGTPEQYRESSCTLKTCPPGTIWDQDAIPYPMCVHGDAATNRPGSNGGRRCKKKNKVKYGFDKRMDKFTAMCDPVTNKATIDIYLFDGANGIRQADEVDRAYLVPEYCSPSNGKSIKSWSKTKSKSKSSRRRRLAVEEEAEEDIGFFGRRNRRLGSSKKKSGSASSATKKSAGKKENNVCLYQYVVDCAIASGRRRLQSLEPPPMFYPQQSPPVPQDEYSQAPLSQEHYSPAPNAPQQQLQPKSRRSLFSRISSIFEVRHAHRRDRLLQLEDQEPLFGGPKVLGTCPKGVSKRTGEVVFNRYLFGNGIQDQVQQSAPAGIGPPSSANGIVSTARRMKRGDIPIVTYEEQQQQQQLRGSA